MAKSLLITDFGASPQLENNAPHIQAAIDPAARMMLSLSLPAASKPAPST